MRSSSVWQCHPGFRFEERGPLFPRLALRFSRCALAPSTRNPSSSSLPAVRPRNRVGPLPYPRLPSVALAAALAEVQQLLQSPDAASKLQQAKAMAGQDMMLLMMSGELAGEALTFSS